MRSARPGFVGIVVPAHDEARRVARSVSAIRRALAHPLLCGTEAKIVVVADASDDSTAERAQHALGPAGDVLEVGYRSAGAARRAGFQHLIAVSEGLSEEDVWLATTDADSVVPVHWLAHQLRWWRRGADGVAGTVTPLAWDEQPLAARRGYEARMSAQGFGHGHPHVHGANLGMTRDTYRAAGGMPEIESGEDHAFWRSAKSAGRVMIHVGDIPVATSTRREGRAPRGFAELLRTLGTGRPTR